MFFKYRPKSKRFVSVPVIRKKDCKPPECVPVQVLPMGSFEAKHYRSRQIVVRSTTVISGGRSGRFLMIQLLYKPGKVEPEKVVEKVKKDKKLWKDFNREVMKAIAVETDGKAFEKEFSKWLKENGIDSVRKNTNNLWSVSYFGGKLYLRYPKWLTKGEAVARILFEDDFRKEIEKLIRTARKDIEKSGLTGEKIPMYGDGSIYFRGDVYKVYYKKSTRPSVKFDYKGKKVVIAGKTISEAKKHLVAYMHGEALKEASKIISALSKAYNVKVTISEKPPGRSSVGGLTYIPFGRTRIMRGYFSIEGFEMEFRPELFLLDDLRRIYIVVHEFAHVITILNYGFFVDEHGKEFYKNLNSILKKHFPRVYSKVKSELDHEVSSVEDEEKILKHSRFIDDTVRKLKPIRL